MSSQSIPILQPLIDIIKYSNIPTEGFPEMYTDYNEFHQGEKEKENIKLKKTKLLLDWLEPESSLLDVGCGDGIVGEYLKHQKNLNVFGLDISEVAKAEAAKHGIDVIIRDINKGLNLERKYDYILLSEVLEHLNVPQKILTEAALNANKGVIVTFPNIGWLPYRIQLLRGYFPRQSFMHIHFWTHIDFLMFCKILGLNVKEFKTLTTDSRFGNILSKTMPNIFSHYLCYFIEPKE